METNRTLEIIRSEIERRLKKYATDVTMPIEELGKVILELKGILDFLSTLESEKPMDLEKMEREEELKKAVHQVSEEIVKEIFPDDLENGDFFTEVDLKNCITRVAYQFADWQKEQMMKGAIPCKVFWLDGPLLDYTQEQQDNALERIGANVGDKVCIIIIKDDGKSD